MLKDGSLRIEGFRESNLTPNGYDVTIEEIWVPSTDLRRKEGVVNVPARLWFVIGTKEYLVLPETIVGEIWIRTTWVRKGILSSFGRIDAGFNGNLTFSAYNASDGGVDLTIGDRFAQVVFEELRSPPAKTYKERSGNYQGQRGITLQPKRDQTN
ncbi:MAG: dCTP deaminase [Euryarchaeota archaeon RBG_19FT_COMBO_56_21]|nr:MAG: dCTP deaminase [Euryarchaeota archaeon RBG_19FT_COMBO_56_21]